MLPIGLMSAAVLSLSRRLPTSRRRVNGAGKSKAWNMPRSIQVRLPFWRHRLNLPALVVSGTSRHPLLRTRSERLGFGFVVHSPVIRLP